MKRGEGKLWGYVVAWILVVATAAGVMLWRQFCFDMGDDYVYRLAVPSGTGKGMQGLAWMCWARELGAGDVWGTIGAHLLYYNGRLSNLIYIAMRPLPDALEQALGGIILVGMFAGVVLAAFPNAPARRCNVWNVAAAIFLTWVMLPWNDGMQSLAFVLNYALPSVAVSAMMFFYDRSGSYGPLRRA
ncbi:MAG: hypothetical protein K2M06_03780, partial [Muribaculaceae bacterium]|nr:hypothetical protein [Muribaculaceae bacterium]